MNTRTTRESQERAFHHVADSLRAVTDDVLWEVQRTVVEIVLDRHKDEMDSPTAKVWRAICDLCVDESNHRQAVLWNAQADLDGGHHLVVTIDSTELGKWSAYCAPVWDGPEFCWEGPNRDTREEAIEDARGHAPNVDPEVSELDE